MPFAANPNFQKKLEVDDYIGKSLDNILMFSSNVVSMSNFDLPMIQQKLRYLINQCENLCIGAGYINREKRKGDPEDLAPEEKALFDAAVIYFKTKPNVVGINYERKAMDLLSEAIEGRYDAKVNRMQNTLNDKVKANELDQFTADTQLDNFRLQLLIDAIQSKKGKKLETGI